MRDRPALLLPAGRHLRAGRLAGADEPAGSGTGAALLEGLIGGEIECIATDHSPHTPEEKLRDNIWQAVSGFVGVETSVQLFLSEAVNAGKMTLPRFVAAAATNPARVWGRASKGQLAAGFDGDVTIVDLKREWVLETSGLHSRNRVTPFDGWRGRGMPVTTLVRGQVVVEDRRLVGTPRGRMVMRSI